MLRGSTCCQNEEAPEPAAGAGESRTAGETARTPRPERAKSALTSTPSTQSSIAVRMPGATGLGGREVPALSWAMFFSRDRRGGMRFFAVFAAFCGAVLLAISAYQFRRDAGLRAHGTQTVGTVIVADTDLRRQGADRTTNHYLTVRYAAAGRTIQHRFSVSAFTFDHSPFGAQVAVVYDPDNPEVASLPSNETPGTAFLMPGIFGLVLIVLAGGLLITARVPPQETTPDLEEALASARKGR
jgi:hypothetical protein